MTLCKFRKQFLCKQQCHQYLSRYLQLCFDCNFFCTTQQLLNYYVIIEFFEFPREKNYLFPTHTWRGKSFHFKMTKQRKLIRLLVSGSRNPLSYRTIDFSVKLAHIVRFEIERFLGSNLLITLTLGMYQIHSVEITRICCHHFVAKIP